MQAARGKLVSEPQSHALEYGPRPPIYRRRRVWRWAIFILLILGVGVGYYERYQLLAEWSTFSFGWLQWRLLHHSISPQTVVYDDDPTRAAALLKDSNYVELPAHAASLKPQLWDEYKARLGSRAWLWAVQDPGALVFLQERHSPAGQSALVCVTFGERPDTHEMVFQLLVFKNYGLTTPFKDSGGLNYYQNEFIAIDGGLFYRPTPDGPKHALRIFAAQPDPNDPTKFYFDYDIDGKPGPRAEFKLDDPDPTSSVPTWFRVIPLRNGKSIYQP